MKITHLGAEQQVTGSSHLLQLNGLNILVDCGLAQGHDTVNPMEQWPVPPDRLDFLFLTHAHIDHIGRLPELIKNGFHGEIITTHATKALLQPMLEDAMAFSDLTEGEIEKLSRTIDVLSWGFEYNQCFDLGKGIQFQLNRAGHILGSCFIRFNAQPSGESVLFSGDIGARNTPLLPDPDVPEPCNLLILESTYGDRLHEDRLERIGRLGEILLRAFSDGGKVFIPAFALGRTQELIYEMDRLFGDPKFCERLGTHSRNPVPVFLDSPLGIRITKIYSALSEYWDKEAGLIFARGDHPLDFDHLYAVESHRDHLRILDLAGPCIIVAGSGMCTGGRIVDHLQLGLEDPRNDVFFVGYQAVGTPGRDIIKYGKRPGGYVDLSGARLAIRAKVHTLTGYSAHADRQGLVDWVVSMAEKPEKIRLVHGEPHSQRILAAELRVRGYMVE